MKRLGFTLALLALMGLAAYGEGLFDRQHLAPYVFYRTEGTVIDSTDSKVFACATYHADTTGNTIEATPTGTGTMTAWYWTNITWDIYDVYWDSAGTAELVADNILIEARVLGDTTITDTLVFGPDCIPGYAIIDDAILSAHIDDDQITVDHYGAGSVDSTAINSQAIGNAHMDMTEQFNFQRIDVDSVGVTDSTYIYMAVAAPESLLLPEDGSPAGAPLYITSPADGDMWIRSGGKWINLAIGANEKVLKSDGSIASWQDDATGAGGADYADSARIAGTSRDFDEYMLADSLLGGKVKAGSLPYTAITATTSANWIGRVSDETGTGVWVFGTSPTFTTQIATPLVDANGASLTLGDGDETVIVNSSDWGIGATGIATGMGNITSDGTIEGAILTEGGTGVYNITQSDAAYLLLASFDDSIAVSASTELTDTADILYEAELDAFSELQTQIADKTVMNEEDVATIDANWVNTANPWADNEVVDALTLSTVSGAVDMGAATSFEAPNAANPTTDAEGKWAWDSNDDAIEVYSGDEAESALIPMYQMADKTIVLPDSLADEIPILRVDALLYPHGIELDQLSITIPADAEYSMVFEEWAGDPPAAQNDIETVTTTAGDSYMEVASGDIDDAAIDADDYIFLHIPSTDVDWIYVQVIFHVKEGN